MSSKRIAIVFGSNGGIGSAVCSELSSEYDVVKVTRDQIDFESHDSHEKTHQKIKEADPSLIVNCVGHFSDNSETSRKTMDINFGSNWSIVRYYIENEASKPVKIIMVGSSSYGEGRKRYMTYAASKAAVYNLWLSCCEYFEGSKVSVSIINPVKTNTKMVKNISPPYVTPHEVAKEIKIMAENNLNDCLNMRYTGGLI